MQTRLHHCRSIAAALLISGVASTSLAASPTPLSTEPDLFVEAWMDLWNGELDLADRLIAEDFTLHATMLDGSDSAAIASPQAFAEWVAASRSAFPDLLFQPVVGPMSGPTDGEDVSLAVHWAASGTYAGGLPGATVPPGTRIEFSGTDVVRITDRRVSHYWLVTDTLALFDALGIR